MLFDGLVEARFIRRLNRFAALVDVGGTERQVHVANSGRMRELLVEGRRILLRPASGDHRKTAFDLALVDLGHTLASADARLPNTLVHEALEEGRLPQFAGYDDIRREATYGESRLDMALEGPSGRCYVETKSVTLVTDNVGLFPDAPTSRGAKHMRSLSKAIRGGGTAARRSLWSREMTPKPSHRTTPPTPSLGLPFTRRRKTASRSTPTGAASHGGR